MNIGKLNSRIIFQMKSIATDEIGNQEETWEDYYSCWATIDTKTGDEAFSSEQVVIVENITFFIRYASKVAALNTDEFRIVFKDKIYNIRAIDDMNFNHKSVKVHAELERRQA